MRSQVIFFLNGQRHEVGADQAGLMLADYLRYQQSLTGTKIVCAEGDCGACSVLRYFPKPGTKTKPVFQTINSCITTVAQMDGSSLVTVDALAKDGLTPVQNAMKDCHGSQCGFCTPGFVMALTGLVEKKLNVDFKEVISFREAKNALTGNLCRCTGYQPILEAAAAIKPSECTSVTKTFFSASQRRELVEIQKRPVHLKDENFEFFAPTSLKEALKFLAKNPKVRILAAATDVGVFHNKWKQRLERSLSLHLIPELYELKKHKGDRLFVGARVTLTELRDSLDADAPEIARFLDIFASPQIKNVATLVGNVANASPIADTPPFLLVSDAVVEVASSKGKRSIPIENFFLDYRKTALKSGELIVGIHFLLPQKEGKLAVKKISERKDLDISSVNAAFRLNQGEVRIAIGGVAAIPLRLSKTESFLQKVLNAGKISNQQIERALQIMQSEIKPLSDVRGTASFRRLLAENALRRFLQEHCQ